MAASGGGTAGKTADQIAADLDKAAEAIANADFLLVVVGPLFDDGGVKNPFESDRCDPHLVSQPNRFAGFWGNAFNAYNDRTPHEGFSIISRWRDRYFCQDDIRKKGKKKPGDDEVSDFDRMAKCLVYTSNIGNQFQRLGLPNDEVFDALGNICLWQCSRSPPCCQRVTPVERNFRFVIDEATKEAMPVKYIVQKPKDGTGERVVVVDSDEEELVSMSGGHVKNPFEVKMSKEDAQRRQQRRLQQPRVVHHHPQTQARQVRERFPDLFTGYATEAGERPLPHAFAQCAYDEQSPRKVPPMPTTAEGDPIPLTPVLYPANVRRCSHLFEHVMALDMGAHNASKGHCVAVDPERYTKEREQSYTGVGKIFTQENHSTLMKRSKYVTYNISMFVSDTEAKRNVLADGVREKLLTVYGKHPPTIPVVSRAQHSNETTVVGTLHPTQAAQLELRRRHLDGWTQGYRGWHYFSNQSPRQSMYDQTAETVIDVVHIAFPPFQSTGSSPVTAVAPSSPDVTEGAATCPTADAAPPPPEDTPLDLPDVCTISIMCETVLDVSQMSLEEQKRYAVPSGCPTRFVNTWQIVGQFQKQSFQDVEFKGKDAVEYVLLGRGHHGVRIGVDKSKPTVVRYIQVQYPSTVQSEAVDDLAEGGSQLGAAFVSHVSASKQKVLLNSSATASSPDAKKKATRPPIPAPNHQLCANCHDIARPFVNMSKPGVKDEGFCSALQAARVKQVKAWEKLMTDCLKSDTSKSIVMLELGCVVKGDPVKAYSEKTFKTLKQSKCTFLRISPQDLDAKAKKGGEEGNAISLVANPSQMLVSLDNLLGERLRNKR